MRRVMTVLGVTSIVVLAAGAAQAGFILPFNAGGLPGGTGTSGDCDIFSQTINNSRCRTVFVITPATTVAPLPPSMARFGSTRAAGPSC